MIGGDTTICIDYSYDISVEEKYNDVGYNIIWENENLGETSSLRTISINPDDIYSVQLEKNGCVSNSVYSNVNFISLSIDSVFANGSKLLAGAELNINSVLKGDVDQFEYSWSSHRNGVNIREEKDLSYYPVETDVYQLTAYNDLFGCSYVSDEVEVEIVSSLSIATAFTPNGDGVNDNWVIEGLESFPSLVLTIYNRWGEQVFINTGAYYNQFDGSYNGSPLSSGVFYYTINFGTSRFTPKSGVITILR